MPSPTHLFLLALPALRNVTLATVFVDVLVTYARNTEEERMLYHAVQAMALLAQGASEWRGKNERGGKQEENKKMEQGRR